MSRPYTPARLFRGSVPVVMEWYGSHHAGDRYTVTMDDCNVRLGINGEFEGVTP